MSNRRFTKEELEFLQEHYEEYMREMRLDELSNMLQRSKTTVCKKARQLGLTNNSRKYLKKWYK